MGYKSVMRSLQSSANAAARESERSRKKLQREQERISKKAAKIDEKMSKIQDSLADLYAKGKVTKKKYEQLKKREKDIDITLIVFGKTPGVSLAKRYICGKIDKKEFDEVCKEIIPSELYGEKEELMNQYEQRCNDLEEFRKSCNSKTDGQCQKCERQKGIFCWLKEVDGLVLCGKCAKVYKTIQNYPGYDGEFFESSPKMINDDNKNELHMSIKSEHL